MSGCKTYETTNAKLATVRADLEELIRRAKADAEHARENDSPYTARDDMRRAQNLEKALKILRECER
jgi:hypothetical protein